MKKIINVILVFVMLFTFVCSCSQSTNTNSDEIVIGCYMPITGANAGSGLCQIQGIQMAFDEINSNGGINGKTLKLLYYDSTGTTEGATKAATRLIENDNVKIILGSFLSSSILAVSPLTEEAKVLHIGVGTGKTWTGIGLDYTYRATANGDLPIETMIDELLDFNIKSISLISVASEYGQSGHDSVVSACNANNIQINADIVYQSGDTDFSGVISKALKANSDTIVMYGLGNEMALIIKQLRQNGYDDILFTIEGGANSEMFTVAGEASNGLVFSAAYVIPQTPDEGATEAIKDVLNRFYEKYNEMPYSDVFYRGYDQGMLAAKALSECSDINDGESIMEAFRNISGYELLGGTFDFTEGTGDGLKQANKWMILDGKVQAYDKTVIDSWRSN